MIFEYLSTLFKPVIVLFLILAMSPITTEAETLEDAWATALSVDPRLKAGLKNTESTRQTLFAAKAALLPSLTLESGYTILDHAPAAAVDQQGFPIKEIVTAEDRSFSYKTTVTLPLFTGGRIGRNIEAAEAGLNSASHEDRKTLLDVKLQVAEAYIGVLRARRLVETAETNVTSLTAHAKDVTNFYEQGMITKNDLLSAQVSLADARQRLIRAMNSRDLASAAYNRLLRRPLDQEVSIEDLSAEPLETNISELTAKALDNRPELSSLSEQAEALAHQAAVIRANRLPQLALSGGYNYTQNKFLVHENVWSATLGLKWELFDGGTSRHKAAALLQKAEALTDIRTDTASFIALQVRQACLDIDETYKRIGVTREAITQSEENLKVTKNRYREGVGTNTEVLDAETLRTLSCNNYYNAIYDAVYAALRLRYAVGNL